MESTGAEDERYGWRNSMILGGFMAGSYPSKGQSLFQLTVFVSDVIDTVSTTTGLLTWK
jgi:hypothetical protein